jgi:hypothetical protein
MYVFALLKADINLISAIIWKYLQNLEVKKQQMKSPVKSTVQHGNDRVITPGQEDFILARLGCDSGHSGCIGGSDKGLQAIFTDPVAAFPADNVITFVSEMANNRGMFICSVHFESPLLLFDVGVNVFLRRINGLLPSSVGDLLHVGVANIVCTMVERAKARGAWGNLDFKTSVSDGVFFHVDPCLC